ncbi:MAG: methyltransferase domain-containing protein [Lactobacillaceae bacterium]|jgi:16S rRNA (cytosine967-C5)-methyltransferase|nr:methyltransferase domain-containing protein [Lactobacillaceae bacterium]
MSEVRRTAVKTLQKILENKVFYSDMREEITDISEKDAAFLNMLILTALRHLVYIRKIIKKFSPKKIAQKHIYVEYAVILAICEILYLRTPEYATINSYVEIIKKKTNKFLGGFANAVLRKVSTNKEALINEDKGEFFPEEFFKILKQDYDTKTIRKIETIAAKEPPLDITVKNGPETWAEELNGALLINGSIRLNSKTDIAKLKGYDNGSWWVQDFAASLAVQIMDELKGKKVLDICAAPGGKSAQLINAGAETTCLDISEQRLETLKENLARLGLKAQNIIRADGLEYLKNFKDEKFDAILLDAPCSATGTMRRHPEIVHIKNTEDITRQSEIQKEFLKHVENALKSGGILVYCTCSINKMEGEEQIKKFLEENKNFKLVSVKEKETNLCHDDTIRTMPFYLEELGGMDSFFIAKLQKVG